jgi:hypothetical protein
MAVNLDKPHLWKADIAQSVDMYNTWFLNFAPDAFRTTSIETTKSVAATLKATGNLTNIRPQILREHPEVLSTLRMSTCPPIAVDRLIGLAGVSRNLVYRMDKHGKLPTRMDSAQLDIQLEKLCVIIERMADPDIFVWLGRDAPATEAEVYRVATIVADRLCGSVANPTIRNAQEKRQLTAMVAWLDAREYSQLPSGSNIKHFEMRPGTYSFRMNVPIELVGGLRVNIPIDAVIMPKGATVGELPIFFEAKSAGDYTNVNKRRKEEATKNAQLKSMYGDSVSFNLLLCGYFDGGYLGYAAYDGIDWVWEHRISDLERFGL